MKAVLGAALVATLSLAAAGSASAAPLPDSPELRCLLVALVAIDKVPAEARPQAMMGVTYYLGRLDARNPGFDVAGTVEAEAQRLQPTDLSGDAQRCSAELQARGNALKALSGAPPASAAPAAPTAKTAPKAAPKR